MVVELRKPFILTLCYGQIQEFRLCNNPVDSVHPPTLCFSCRSITIKAEQDSFMSRSRIGEEGNIVACFCLWRHRLPPHDHRTASCTPRSPSISFQLTAATSLNDGHQSCTQTRTHLLWRSFFWHFFFCGVETDIRLL